MQRDKEQAVAALKKTCIFKDGEVNTMCMDYKGITGKAAAPRKVPLAVGTTNIQPPAGAEDKQAQQNAGRNARAAARRQGRPSERSEQRLLRQQSWQSQQSQQMMIMMMIS